MKALARSFVWWPEIDRAVAERVQQCFTCQLTCDMPPKAPLQSLGVAIRALGLGSILISLG